MYKVIHLTIPSSFVLPDDSFTPEETAIVLQVGYDALKEARTAVAGLTQQEMYTRIKKETSLLEKDLLIQKETSKNMQHQLTCIYETKMESLTKQLDTLRFQLKQYEYDQTELVRKEVDKTREKFETILFEKEKQIQKIHETHDFILLQSASSSSNKSNSHKGKEGEKEFETYAYDTFRDFHGYNLMDKHTQGGSGDFHLHFEEFDVLVDAKNYKKKVPVEQREKIKKDLIKNQHIPFAWLVSLNTNMDKFDKSPVMYEWVNTKQCIVYINNLTQHEDPRTILRIVWFTCKELFKLVKDDDETDTAADDWKEKQFKLMDKVKKIRKTIREINTTLNTTRNMIQIMDDELKEILETETEKIVTSNYSVFDSWWDANISLGSSSSSSSSSSLYNEEILSTDLWTKFKKDNALVIKGLDITTDKFKQFIKTKVPLSNITLKSKNANTAFIIQGIQWKTSTEISAVTEVPCIPYSDVKI
jgi:hypothetical protein